MLTDYSKNSFKGDKIVYPVSDVNDKRFKCNKLYFYTKQNDL